MSEQHPIDELFRKQLEERKPEFDEAYWQEATQLLNRHKGTALKGSQWKLWSLVGAVVIAGAAIGFYIGTNNLRVKEAEDAAPVVVEQGVQTTTGNISTTSAAMSTDASAATEQVVKEYMVTTEQHAEEEGTHSESKAVSAYQPSSAANSPKQQEAATDESGTKQQQQQQLINHKQEGEDLKDESSNVNASTSGLANASGEASAKDAMSTAEWESQKNTGNEGNTHQADVPDQHITISKHQYGKFGEGAIHPFLSLLAVPPYNLSADRQPPITIAGTAYDGTAFMKSNHWSKVKSFELSATGGLTIITVPSTKSSATGFEWNALLHYRVNNWLAGAGVGQFSVKDHFSLTEDSVEEDSYLQPVITVDSTMLVDSFFVIIDSMLVLMYDTTFQLHTDTSYQQVTMYDTITQTKTLSSSGRYLEIPFIIGYRFPLGKCRLQVSGGAAYGWYSGGLRYGINSEGQLISYKPGAVLSLTGRLTVQYPIHPKILLQAYTGARYVIGLKKDVPEENYLLYSFGAGVLYRF